MGWTSAMAFTDGVQVAATLDRNGLRPARYVVTDDDLVIMSSEVGVLRDIPEHKIIQKWRLQPGKMLLVDLNEKRIISDEELKDNLVNLYPYDDWVKNSKVNIKSIDFNTNKTLPEDGLLLDLQQAFGYNKEDLKFFLEPMILEGQDPMDQWKRHTLNCIIR